MAIKTFHVYPSEGRWVVKKEGKRAALFPTQAEAIKAATDIVRDDSGQLVIHGVDGRIRDSKVYRMVRVQDPPKKSRAAKRINNAVGKVALKRVKSTTRERATEA